MREFNRRYRKDSLKIQIDKGDLCPFCLHHKSFSCLAEGSSNFNRRKCSRCKRWF